MMDDKRRRLARLFLLLDGGGSPWRVFTAPANGTVVTLTSLGIPATGLCTVLWHGVCSAVGTGAAQQLFQIDANTDNNRLGTRNVSGSGVIQSFRTTSGSLVGSNAGNASAGVAFRCGMALDGAGGFITTIGGAATVSGSGAPASGLTRLRIGDSVGANSPLTGSTYLVRVLPNVALSDADLIAAVNAL